MAHDAPGPLAALLHDGTHTLAGLVLSFVAWKLTNMPVLLAWLLGCTAIPLAFEVIVDGFRFRKTQLDSWHDLLTWHAGWLVYLLLMQQYVAAGLFAVAVGLGLWIWYVGTDII